MFAIRLSAAVLLASFVTPVAAEVENAGKIVCKSEQQNGTRIPKRTCRTAGEWDLLAENARRSAAESFNRSNRPWQGDDGSGDLLSKNGQLTQPGGPH